MYKNSLKVRTIKLIKRLIVIVAVILLIFFIVKLLDIALPSMNTKLLTDEEKLYKSYNTPIYGDLELTDEEAAKIVKLLSDYNDYCNNKDYEKAYALLDEECKKNLYPDIEKFKETINKSYDKIKRFEYKNLSNIEGIFAYEVYLYDDVMIYGTDGNLNGTVYTMIVKRDKNKEFKLSIDGYVKTEYMSYATKYKDCKITIKRKDIYYDYMNVVIEVDNNTDYTFLYLVDEIKYSIYKNNKEYEYNYWTNDLNYTCDYVLAKSTGEFTLKFKKRFDTVEYNDLKLSFNEAYFVNYDVLAFGYIKKSTIVNNNVEKFDIQIAL